jgi:AAA family ATP:ADP antiporter
LQGLRVARLVKHAGLRGVLLFLPVVAFGAYATIAAGAGFALLRWLKTAENAGDYSVMNTGRQMLWLPTSREEKYRAKQAMDTFVVRMGDVLATVLVAGSISLLHLGAKTLAIANAVLSLAWIAVALRVATLNRAPQAEPVATPAPAPAMKAQAA